MTAGYKNLFTITGPGSPSILVNVFVAIEQHVEWIRDCLAHLASKNLSAIEALPSAEKPWGEEVQNVANRTLLAKANSWYVGANIEGKPKVFLPYAGGMANTPRFASELLPKVIVVFGSPRRRCLRQRNRS